MHIDTKNMRQIQLFPFAGAISNSRRDLKREREGGRPFDFFAIPIFSPSHIPMKNHRTPTHVLPKKR